MPKFRKRPVVIEAIQFTGTEENFLDLKQFVGNAKLYSAEGLLKTGDGLRSHILIRTLEGNMAADRGDWIIRGVQGECYPCKPDIFAETYEAVEEGGDHV